MKIATILWLLLMMSLSSVRVEAMHEEIDLVNRPVNLGGLTGLIVTTSPFTIKDKVVETAVSATSETSAVPDFTLNEILASITVGITHSVELAVRSSYITRDELLNPPKKGGTGDTELLAKWNFLPQDEKPYIPAVAAFLAIQGLTGNRENGFQRTHNWGARIGISVGRELAWEEHVAGVYLDGQLAVEDLNRNEYRDRYGIFNAGILLPISKRQNLQLLFEYGAVTGKLYEDIDGKDISTITYGIRLVSERFNMTIGSQFIHKDIAGYSNSGKVLGTLSIKY